MSAGLRALGYEHWACLECVSVRSFSWAMSAGLRALGFEHWACLECVAVRSFSWLHGTSGPCSVHAYPGRFVQQCVLVT
eukprot:537849-Pelagomonas_calceolata.AAC.1